VTVRHEPRQLVRRLLPNSVRWRASATPTPQGGGAKPERFFKEGSIDRPECVDACRGPGYQNHPRLTQTGPLGSGIRDHRDRASGTGRVRPSGTTCGSGKRDHLQIGHPGPVALVKGARPPVIK